MRGEGCQSLIFDLDRTLTDSAESVRSSLVFALESCEILLVAKLNPRIVGLTLPEMVRDLTGVAAPATLDRLLPSHGVAWRGLLPF